MNYDDSHDRRALDAIARDAGIEGRGSHIDVPLTREDICDLSHFVGALVGSSQCVCCAIKGTASGFSGVDAAEVFVYSLKRCRTLREVFQIIKPHVAALHALLQTIEPKEEV